MNNKIWSLKIATEKYIFFSPRKWIFHTFQIQVATSTAPLWL